MKTVFDVLIFLFLIGCLSCEKKQDESVVQALNCSECKNNIKSTDLETIHFTFISNDELLVEHSNVNFNCEPGKISVTGRIDQDTINIYEEEAQHNADCICPYDLSFKIKGLKDGENTINIFLMDYKKLECKLNYALKADTIIEIQTK